MKRKEKVNLILKKLGSKYGDPKTPLNHKTDFQLLIGVILSAQCTDERVNMVTPSLFKKFKDINSFAESSIEEIRENIKSISFPNNKAKNIKKTAEIIISDYNGKVPSKMEDLLKLAGVGRKTANVVLGEYFKKPQGIVVDTHVGRLSVRIGLTSTEDSKKAIDIEKDLIKIVPKKDWIKFSLYLVFYGREICKARKPNCQECIISNICKRKKYLSRRHTQKGQINSKL